MALFRRLVLLLLIFSSSLSSFSQDTAYRWKVESRRLDSNRYELTFSSPGSPSWDLYAPNQVIADVPAAELNIQNEGVKIESPLQTDGNIRKVQSDLFETEVSLLSGAVNWKAIISFDTVPSQVRGNLLYTYGRGEEFYAGVTYSFSVSLEGGVSSASRILIPAINQKNPVAPCGDDNTEGQSLLYIFMLGFLGGLIALITPCVFPLIPLTVSFFTKKSGSRGKGIRNALLYGLSIFLIYAALSIPFHLISGVNPEVLNNISTNVWLNIAFFVIFIFFALSFFGLYEIGLPSGMAGKIDSRSGMSNFWGIFFMALTLAIVSFSCTGPILGTLLAGVLTNDNGALQLTFGMSGFGLGLALPFALFALFPNWLTSLPKSGGWLTDVKVVLGFIELALAIKFLSNADLVKQWRLLPREVFIGLWVLLGFATVLYLIGKLPIGPKQTVRFSKARIFFIALFSAFTLYLIPGLTNTKWARLPLISGFPPPFSYSLYSHSVNHFNNVIPILNDYEGALRKAKAEGKPLLIDFTGWACVNCRRMEEKVWVDEEVGRLMKEEFIIVSLYVDERAKLPVSEQQDYTSATGDVKPIVTVGDKWATFQYENFFAVAQPQYAILGSDEQALTKTKAYTPSSSEFAAWLRCGVEAYKKRK